jgi:hypothetical protein
VAIRFVQGATTGGFGEAIHGVSGVSVTCSSDVSGSTYTWKLKHAPINPDKPSYDSALVSGTTISTSATANFLPDCFGEFQIELTVDSNAPVTNCFSVPDAEGLIDPSYEANPDNTKYGTNTRGWSYHLTRLFNAILNRVPTSRQVIAGSGITVNGGASADLSANVTIASTGSGGHTIRESGVDQTTRTALNFLSDFSLTDDAGNNETEITLASTLAPKTFQSSAAATAPITADSNVAAGSTRMLLDLKRQGASKWWVYLNAAEELVFETEVASTAFWATTGFGVGPAAFTPAAALHARTSATATAADPAGIFDKNIAAIADNYLLSLRRQNTEYFGIRLDASNAPTIVAASLSITGTLNGYVPTTRRVIASTEVTVAGGGGGSNDQLTADLTLGLAASLSPHTFASTTDSVYPIVVEKTLAATASNKLYQGTRSGTEVYYVELDATDNIRIGCAASKAISLYNGTSQIATFSNSNLTMLKPINMNNQGISGVASFTPQSNNALSIGSTSLNWLNLFCRNLNGPGTGSVSKVEVGDSTDLFIKFYTNGLNRWTIDSAGKLQNNVSGNEATTASAGTNGAPPAQVAGYFIVKDSAGTDRKIPYYAT